MSSCEISVDLDTVRADRLELEKYAIDSNRSSDKFFPAGPDNVHLVGVDSLHTIDITA